MEVVDFTDDGELTDKLTDAELEDFDPDDFDPDDCMPGTERPHLSVNKGMLLTLSTFNDFLLKPELLRALFDAGLENPSQGMHYI